MEFNRRDLLKFFGVGATIVPVLGGVPKIEAPARLIEEARIQPVELATIQDLPRKEFFNRELMDITVDMVTARDHYRFQAHTFITNMNHELIEVPGPGAYRHYLPGYREVRWSMTGFCMADSSCTKIK